jgi:hypothetical protein
MGEARNPYIIVVGKFETREAPEIHWLNGRMITKYIVKY